MAPDSTPSQGGGRMSLYANLLDPSAENAPGTISRAPVVFKRSSESDDAQPDESAVKKQQLNAASLRFQPTKRPQLNQKSKTKHTLPKAAPQPTAGKTAPSVVPPKTTVADWTAMDDDFGYTGEKRQRGGRKKRKKNRDEDVVEEEDWSEIYDPARPTNIKAYWHSEERVRAEREWKDRLYAHRRKRVSTQDTPSDDHDRSKSKRFAPPASFAPPANLNDVPPAPASLSDDPSGEDAFARRARMSQRATSDNNPDYDSSIPPPPTGEAPPPADNPYMHPFQTAQHQPASDNAPAPTSRLDSFQPSSATISRAPVRYALPPPPEDIPASEAELEEVFAKEQPAEEEEESSEGATRSLRPGQKGFAERLLSKYGWTEGSGLGATGSGIAKPLQVRVEKRKKRPDSEGGGFVTPSGRGTIIGGKKQGGEDTGKFGPMSEVIVLRGMLNGMDIASELENSETGGLMQEIGEECNAKYGTVERVFIARDAGTPVPVFVKFVSPLSALRAVNALEGRIFNGNAIQARFFDPEKFEQGIYVD